MMQSVGSIIRGNAKLWASWKLNPEEDTVACVQRGVCPGSNSESCSDDRYRLSPRDCADLADELQMYLVDMRYV